MLKSMTAYGSAAAVFPFGRVTVELHTVNRKHLEIQSFLQRDLQRFDHEIRKLIGRHFQRGQITLRLNIHYSESSPGVVSPNLVLVKQTWGAWQSIAEALGLSHQLSLSLLNNDSSFFITESDQAQDEKILEGIRETLERAIAKMEVMRAAEGEMIENELLVRIEKLKECTEEIAHKAPEASERYRLKLQHKLAELSHATVEHEERLLREVCLYADRVDIAEELSRLRSHFKQFQKILSSSHANQGKTLEFLLQEMMREVNTTGSKSADIGISHLVVEMKSELEKMREQIQNVE